MTGEQLPVVAPAAEAADAAEAAENAEKAPAVPECYDDVCITCSDQAVQARVVRLHAGHLATVDTGRGLEEVSVALVVAEVDDIVLVHAKEAIGVVFGR
jgi:hydrogenase expression/formation protein HypC